MKLLNKRNIVIAVIIIIIIGVLLLLYFNSKECKDKLCFEQAMKKCRRAEYTEDSDIASWRYEIYGKQGDNCKINVVLLQVKQGGNELEQGAGLNMNCYITRGLIINPVNDLSLCHGKLKEFMQLKIIENLHQYIVNKIEK